jgi:sucrose phosphorylase
VHAATRRLPTCSQPQHQISSSQCSGINLIRLDAFGYTTKKAGTNCFFVEPEIWELLDRVKANLEGTKTELLCEVHEHYALQKLLAEKGLWVYDFALPMLCLQARFCVT